MLPTKNLLRRATCVGTAAALVVTAPSPAFASGGPQPFSPPQDAASYERALRCLTEAVYYEARSESDEGQRAVAQVVLNRVRHPAYPNSVCGVVYQGSHRQTGCQFTFTCDGSLGGYIDAGAWARAGRIAAAALGGSVYRPVGLALNYHTTAIRPYWAPSLVRQAVIGAHIFYRRPDSGEIGAFRQYPAEIEPRAGGHAASAARRTAPARGERIAADYRSPGSRQGAIDRPRVERPVVQQARVERPTIQQARVERPTVQRVVFERPVSSRISGARRAATAAKPKALPAARPSGPRTTIENGVRVARGS